MTFDSHAHRWKRDAGHVCSRLPPSTTGAGRQAELAAPVSGETFSLDIPFHRTLSPREREKNQKPLPSPVGRAFLFIDFGPLRGGRGGRKAVGEGYLEAN